MSVRVKKIQLQQGLYYGPQICWATKFSHQTQFLLGHPPWPPFAVRLFLRPWSYEIALHASTGALLRRMGAPYHAGAAPASPASLTSLRQSLHDSSPDSEAPLPTRHRDERSTTTCSFLPGRTLLPPPDIPLAAPAEREEEEKRKREEELLTRRAHLSVAMKKNLGATAGVEA